ncbi:MAG: thioredoxin family protein [Opitutales bacterium]
MLPLGRLLAQNSASSPEADQPLQWGTDYVAAVAKANAENKRILINFSGSDWCHWCKVMDEETLSRQAFKDYADQHLVLLLADTPRKKLPEDLARQNDALKRRFYIDGFPTFVVLDKNGSELDRRVGYVRGGPQSFIAFLNVTEFAETPPPPEPTE